MAPGQFDPPSQSPLASLDWSNDTALQLASKKGHTDIVHLMCDHGANVDSKGRVGRTALHLASAYGHLSTVECLLGRGASVNKEDDNRWTPLDEASSRGRVSIVSLIQQSKRNLE